MTRRVNDKPEGRPLSEVFSEETSEEFVKRVKKELGSRPRGSSQQWARRWKALAKRKSRKLARVTAELEASTDAMASGGGDLVLRAATKFVRAAKYAREADVRRARMALEGDPVEHLGLLEDYHRAMASLAGAEQDLILAVEEREE